MHFPEPKVGDSLYVPYGICLYDTLDIFCKESDLGRGTEHAEAGFKMSYTYLAMFEPDYAIALEHQIQKTKLLFERFKNQIEEPRREKLKHSCNEFLEHEQHENATHPQIETTANHNSTLPRNDFKNETTAYSAISQNKTIHHVDYPHFHNGTSNAVYHSGANGTVVSSNSSSVNGSDCTTTQKLRGDCRPGLPDESTQLGIVSGTSGAFGGIILLSIGYACWSERVTIKAFLTRIQREFPEYLKLMIRSKNSAV